MKTALFVAATFWAIVAFVASASNRAQREATDYLRKQVSSPVVEAADWSDDFCNGAIYCFKFRGIDTTGQLQKGLIRSGWKRG